MYPLITDRPPMDGFLIYFYHIWRVEKYDRKKIFRIIGDLISCHLRLYGGNIIECPLIRQMINFIKSDV